MELNRTHILYDMWLADTGLLEAIQPWQQTLLAAAKASGATILKHHFHQFSPTGITGFLLLAESHISVHTWPEEGLATVDIFTCGPMDTTLILTQLRRRFQPVRESVKSLDRGLITQTPPI